MPLKYLFIFEISILLPIFIIFTNHQLKDYLKASSNETLEFNLINLISFNLNLFLIYFSSLYSNSIYLLQQQISECFHLNQFPIKNCLFFLLDSEKTNKESIMTNQLKQKLIVLNKHSQRESLPQTSFLSLFRFADRTDKYLMAIGTLSAIGAGVASPLFMIFFASISEIFIPGNQSMAQRQGRQLFFYLFAVGSCTWLLHALAMWAWNKSGQRQTIRLKEMYYKALLQQQVSWYDSVNSFKITTEISQNTIAIQTAIGQKISFAITAFMTSLFGFVYSFFKCWQMSLYLSIFLPFMLAAGFLLIKSHSMKASVSKISYQNASGIAQNAFSSIKTIKSLVGQKYEAKKFKYALIQTQSKVKSTLLYASLAAGFMLLIMLALYSYGFFIGKSIMIKNSGIFKASDIISTFFCFLVAGQSIGQISPIFKNIADAKVAVSKIYELIGRTQQLKQNKNGIKIEQIDKIIMSKVQFGYCKNQRSENSQEKLIETKKILKDINIKMEKGSVIAVVGQSGGGKSTITQLLLHYYDTSKGEIKINGIDIHELETYSYRRKIGYVGQEPVLFSMSIKDNIKLSNPNISDEQIKQVLVQANAWEFVSKLDNGIDTYVGSKGAQLSGGQKQRIAIARALAKKPCVFILDEATSALDQQSQRQIQKTIKSISSGRQTIMLIISHRLSTIKNADNILVLKDGKIAEQGNHEELIQRQQIYYNLIKNQLENSQQNIKNNLSMDVQAEKKELKLEKKFQFEELEGEEKNPSINNIDQNRISIYKKLMKQSRKLWVYLVVGSIFAIINGIVYPFFNSSFSNLMGLMANPDQNNDQINEYCFTFLMTAIIGSLSNFIHTYAFSLYGQNFILHLRIRLFNQIVKFPCSYFDKKENTPGAISVKLSKDTYQLHNFLTGILSVFFLNSATIITTLIFAFAKSWKLTLIVLIFSPLMAAKGAIATAVLKRMSKQSEEIEKFLGSFINDTISNIRTVKSFGGYDQFITIFNEKARQIQKVSSNKFLKLGILQGFSRASATLVYAIVFWVAAALFTNGQLSQPRDALVSIICIVFAATTVGQNSQLMPDIIKAENAAKNLLKIVETKNEYELSKQKQEKPLRKNKIKGIIEFKNVNFSYPSRKQQILINLSLKINDKETVCLIGSSGSGKSTLISILCRLYPISSGIVLLDGHPIEGYSLKKIRRWIGVLMQQPVIFKGTIQQNIRYPKTIHKSIQQFCKKACVNKIAQKYQEQYKKEVGERGSQVSGGEKQRIALARMLMKNPKIMVMDEPTSALDVDTEHQVLKNMEDIIRKKTVIYTTHRLSTARIADRVLVMKAGCIVQEGSYHQLVNKKNGEFNRLLIDSEIVKNEQFRPN